jgi:hypothetical protein
MKSMLTATASSLFLGKPLPTSMVAEETFAENEPCQKQLVNPGRIPGQLSVVGGR